MSGGGESRLPVAVASAIVPIIEKKRRGFGVT
jgi:hypothetical protein